MATPVTLQDAIQKLETMYPDRFPRQFLSEYEQGVRTGALEVIDHLRLLRDGPLQ
jgi:hypothetical protein